MGHVMIDGHTYNQLNNLFGDRSSEFYHEQTMFAGHYRLEHNDNLPNTLFWNYLEARRSLNPERFDHYHPIVGEWIKDIPLVPPIIPPITPPIIPPPIIPSFIGEPGSGILLGIGIIVILIIKRFR